MFFHFEVTPDHYFRFLWYQDNDFTKSPTHYRFTVHVFDVKSSPSVANFGFKQVSNEFEFKYGQSAADFIRHSFDIDDGLMSVTTVEEESELMSFYGKQSLQMGHARFSWENLLLSSTGDLDP